MRRPTARIPLLALIVAAAGCGAPERDPVESNRVLEAGDEGAVRRLGGTEQAEAIDAMRSAFAGVEPKRPTPATHGVRWSDVPAAAYWAGLSVEFAILESQVDAERARFVYVGVRDEPAELLVERRPPPEMFIVRARVGTLGQRVDVAATFEAEFRAQLLAFGRKPGFDD
jgi:hypothetical protein